MYGPTDPSVTPTPPPSPFLRPSAPMGPIGTAPAAPTPTQQGMTPQQVEAMQGYAKAMDEQAYGQQKNQWGVPGGISSPWQGVAKMVQAYMGGRAAAMAGQGQAAGIRGTTIDPTNPIQGGGYGGGGMPSAAPVPVVPSTPAPPQTQTLGTGSVNLNDPSSMAIMPFQPNQNAWNQ